MLYKYDSNVILVKPLKSRNDSDIITTNKKLYNMLKKSYIQPKLHIMDNEASKTLKTFITNNNTEYQLVEPYNCQVNAAERAICTFKNFIAGLRSVDPDFPIYLWNQLLPKAQFTLNLL